MTSANVKAPNSHFLPPAGSSTADRIPYLSTPPSLDEEALRLLSYAVHITGLSADALLSDAVKDWYEVTGGSLLAEVQRRSESRAKMKVVTGGKTRSQIKAQAQPSGIHLCSKQ